MNVVEKMSWKQTINWPWGQRSRSHEGHYITQQTALWSCTHIPNIIDLSRKTKMLWPGQENTIYKTNIWPWGQRSRSHEGHYGTQHTALCPCIHIPNIIDLSGKTNKLWSAQASLRRSRSERKKSRLKQYVSLRSKGRHNNHINPQFAYCLIQLTSQFFWEEIKKFWKQGWFIRFDQYQNVIFSKTSLMQWKQK